MLGWSCSSAVPVRLMFRVGGRVLVVVFVCICVGGGGDLTKSSEAHASCWGGAVRPWQVLGWS